MKTIISAILILFVSKLAGSAQPGLPLTNDVPIVDYGMRLALCNASVTHTNTRLMFDQTELKADENVEWILHNATTNQISVIFLGMTNSFDLKLYGANGEEIPKTEKGKAMSVGPKSLTSIKATNPQAHRIGGHLDIMEFPKLTELFQFPSAGVYILEVRYWGWSSRQRFILSDPVRLRVIKEDKNNTPTLRNLK